MTNFNFQFWDTRKVIEARVCSANKEWMTQEGFHAQEPHRVLLGFRRMGDHTAKNFPPSSDEMGLSLIP